MTALTGLRPHRSGLSRADYKRFRLNRGGPPSKLEYPPVSDSAEYREGSGEKYLEQRIETVSEPWRLRAAPWGVPFA